MSPIDFNRFSQLANGNSDRLVLSNQGQDVGPQSTGRLSGIARVFKQHSKLMTENKAVRKAFHNAIKTEYGNQIAGRVFPVNNGVNTPLSSRIVQQVLRQASDAVEAAREQSRTNQMARTDVLTQVRTQKLDEANIHLSPHGHWKLEVMQAHSLKENDIPLDDIESIGDITDEQITAMGDQLAIDRSVQQMETSDVYSAHVQNVDRIVDEIDYPDARRAELYKDFVRDALLNVAENAMVLDERDGCPLLKTLGESLAKQFDDLVSYAIAAESSSRGQTNYNQLMDDVTAIPTDFFIKNIGTFQRIQSEVETFSHNMNEAMERVNADKDDISTTFFNGADSSNLTDIHMTDSDPHHGGHRVLILKFNDNDDHRVVYKPRDCRVDAKLMGTPNVGGNGPSVGGLINEIRGAGTMPTYKYLLGGDNNNEYGYAQFLSHTENDRRLTTENQVNDYMRDMGRLAAVSYLFGVTDQHQGNVMVHGGRPYLTDLEIAFSQDVLDPGKGIGGTGLQDGIVKNGESQYVSPLVVAENVITGTSMKLQPSETKNRVQLEIDGKDSTPLKDWKQSPEYVRAFRSGFEEIIETFSGQENNQALLNLMNDFADMHVRYHPVGTPAQLLNLEAMRLSPTTLREDYMPAFDHLDTNHDGQTLKNIFTASMKSDLVNGDVPYYTRALGNNDDVFHNGDPDTPLTDPEQEFGYDGLARSKARVQGLTEDVGKQSMVEALNKFSPEVVVSEN